MFAAAILDSPSLESEVDLSWGQLQDAVFESLKFHCWVGVLERVELHDHRDQLLSHGLRESLSEADAMASQEGAEGKWVAMVTVGRIEML